ncbi:hypothetical protein J4E89_009520 [Alternaria sp. Ai002NY15]|nr:hypothetical protein J4E89_009520 [Alternaria sp. Ai002NY15]
MTTAKETQAGLPLRWQRCINRLNATLVRRGLFTVIEEVLSPATPTFDQAILQGRKALKVPLGDRKQSDGITVPVWAYVLLDSNGSEPSIVFRDEVQVHSNGAETAQLYPRSASSLLRKANHLKSPFSLLHLETDEGVKDGRGMLCAVIAYYALIAGLSDCAIRWRRFDACMIAALDYINITLRWMSEIQHEPAPSTATAIKPSLIVRLPIGREALAKITGVPHGFEVPDSEDEGDIMLPDEDIQEQPDNPNATHQPAVPVLEDVSDTIDSVFGDDVAGVAEEVDSVIGDANDSIIVANSRSQVHGNEQACYPSLTIRKRKLEDITAGSDGDVVEEMDGHGWRQASWGRSRRR